MPDLLNEVNAALREGKSVGEAMQIAIEHQRLQSALVDAAKAWRKSESKPENEAYAESFDKMLRAQRVFRESVSALIVFEAEHGIGEK